MYLMFGNNILFIVFIFLKSVFLGFDFFVVAFRGFVFVIVTLNNNVGFLELKLGISFGLNVASDVIVFDR